jgi:heparan-alpha-glucosaminide N-acetyltransferase
MQLNTANTRPGIDSSRSLALQNSISTSRVLAIDAFRGITILIMIFVNTLAGVRGMPAWMDHMPADVDGMTFPDVVFPAFLFIVGMSIPFAIAQRIAKGDSTLQLQKHIVMRAFGLIVLGVFMVNAEDGYNEQAMHMSIYLWSLLFYACAILVWNVYRSENKTPALVLRTIGVIGFLILAYVFRGGPDGTIRLAPQWWGILGLIGWAYLIACIFYQLGKGRILPLLGALAFCVLYYCIGHLDAIKDAPVLQLLLSQSDDASHTSIVLCGLICSLIFFDENTVTAIRTRFLRAAGLALCLLVIGYLLRPYFKISKIYATPTWCLYSAAICIAIFAFLYWLVDLKSIRAWTTFFRPAASNPLLTYIIPYIVYALMQYLHWSFPSIFQQGWPGLLWAAGYAIAVMALVIGLNRMNIKLQL